jgi:hypothetical protein
MGMVPINRRKISLYEEAKNGLSSLVWQTATVFVGFIFILLLTGGNPSGFAITITFISGIGFVAWREQSRVTKLRFKDTLIKRLAKIKALYIRESEDSRNKTRIHSLVIYKGMLLQVEEYASGDANVYSENFVNHGEFISEKSINFTARDISSSVVNLGEINGNVTNTINQLSDSQSPNKSELAGLLTQLQSAINSEDSVIDDKDKAKALKHIESIGKLGSNQNDATLREKAEDALDALIGIAAKFTSFFGIAKPLIDSVKSILNL